MMLHRKSSRTQLRTDAGDPIPRPSSAASAHTGPRTHRWRGSKDALSVNPADAIRGPKSAPPSSYVPFATRVETAPYTHSSVFRNAHMEMRVRSPSVKALRHQGDSFAPRSLPIFGDHDYISGTVQLDPERCGSHGRVSITIEGTFTYSAQSHDPRDGNGRRHTHVFWSETAVPYSPVDDAPAQRTSTLRDTFSLRKKSSAASLRAASAAAAATPRVFTFKFDVPRANRPGEELPPTFASSTVLEGGVRTRASLEATEVAYRLIARWDAGDGSDQTATLAAPVLLQPDNDWSSLDGLSVEPEAWLEVPLKSDRPIPFQCAVTVPNPAAFPRSGALPFFCVFTTTPRDAGLAREIAADATVAVTLARVMTIQPARSAPPSPTVSSVSMPGAGSAQSPSSAGSPLPPLRVRTLSNAGAPLPFARARTPSSAGRSSAAYPPSSSSPGTPTPSSGGPSGAPGRASPGEDAEHQFVVYPRPKLLHRVVRSAPPIITRAATAFPPAASPPPKPIPPPRTPSAAPTPAPGPAPAEPPQTVRESRTVLSEIAVGFPKRPRAPAPQGKGKERAHPTLAEQRAMPALPDGLYKGKLQLSRGMLPGIEWRGLSVKYYLDVSVLFEQEVLRARIPVRIF